MSLIEHSTSTLSGVKLDQAVAMALGLDWHIHNGALHLGRNAATGFPWSPSTNWAHGGPLLDERIAVLESTDKDAFWARCIEPSTWETGEGSGQTPLIAVCRAIATSKLGDEVDL